MRTFASVGTRESYNIVRLPGWHGEGVLFITTLSCIVHVRLPISRRRRAILKGNSHQILLSEMSLPGVEVPIEKLLPEILGRLGKENPSKRRCKVAFVQRKCAVTSSVSVQFLYATYN